MASRDARIARLRLTETELEKSLAEVRAQLENTELEPIDSPHVCTPCKQCDYCATSICDSCKVLVDNCFCGIPKFYCLGCSTDSNVFPKCDECSHILCPYCTNIDSGKFLCATCIADADDSDDDDSELSNTPVVIRLAGTDAFTEYKRTHTPDCSICTEDTSNASVARRTRSNKFILLICGHAFHKNCIVRWVKTKVCSTGRIL